MVDGPFRIFVLQWWLPAFCEFCERSFLPEGFGVAVDLRLVSSMDEFGSQMVDFLHGRVSLAASNPWLCWISLRVLM